MHENNNVQINEFLHILWEKRDKEKYVQLFKWYICNFHKWSHLVESLEKLFTNTKKLLVKVLWTLKY